MLCFISVYQQTSTIYHPEFQYLRIDMHLLYDLVVIAQSAAGLQLHLI